MSQQVFEASRVSGDGNMVFPATIVIDTDAQEVRIRKKKLIGSDETKIRFDAIACIEVSTHVLFADVIIETRGGRQIAARGFKRRAAEQIKELLSF